jgi:putative Ca2+/H+ antiporter (TMEM165/GDT1 family)
VARLRLAGLVLVLTVQAAGCRGGMAGRAAPMPHPTDLAGWLAIVVFLVGGWWLLMKILRG